MSASHCPVCGQVSCEYSSPPPHAVSADTAFFPPFGTVRQCLDCGALVGGGPTRCSRCARDCLVPGPEGGAPPGPAESRVDNLEGRLVAASKRHGKTLAALAIERRVRKMLALALTDFSDCCDGCNVHEALDASAALDAEEGK